MRSNDNVAAMREVIESLLDLLYDCGIDERTVETAHQNVALRESMHTERKLKVLRKARKILSDTKKYCGRKTAMWKNGTDYEYEFAYCSACGHMQFADWNTHCEAREKIGHFHEQYHYCPACGAEMKGGTYIE
jgi:NADH pyrophosphatase NudC (nudix superfamily)